jgi:hypothetical protein
MQFDVIQINLATENAIRKTPFASLYDTPVLVDRNEIENENENDYK